MSDFWTPSFEITRQDDGTIYMCQPEELPAYEQTLADYLDHWADTTPNQPWIARRGPDGQWIKVSYGQTRDTARRMGAALLGLGLGPTKPLLVLSEHSIEHSLISLACAYVGIPYAPLSPAYSLVSTDHGKLKDIAALLEPGAIFADDGQAFSRAIASISGPKVISVRNIESGSLDFADLAQTDPSGSAAARAAINADTTLKYLFTSGSTGSPKAVINTNRMICANQAMVRDCYRFVTQEPPVVLDWAPWNHTAASNKVSYMVLTNGGTYYIDDGNPSPKGMETTIANLKDVACTWYFNVPAGHDRLVEALETDEALAKTFFSKLRMVFFAGAGMSQLTWDRLSAVGRKTTGSEVLVATSLGATETAPMAVAWTEIEAHAGNVGVPMKGLTMKLAPSGDKLEFRLKGPSITPGYYGDPDKTAESFDEEGYYKMGDALRPIDPNDLTRGFLFDGRLAENFKLSTGTWVSVGVVRTAIVDSMDGLIRDAVIVGENQSELGALLWLSDKGAGMDAEALQAALDEKLTAHQKAATGSASRIKRIAVLPAAPSFDKGELTEKGSLNQRALRANNTALIETLYA